MEKRHKGPWRFLKIAIIVLLCLLVVISVLPFFFKGRIMNVVKAEINKEVNAKIDFHDFSLSLIRNFPNFSCRIDDITVTGIDDFEGDTLAKINSVALTIDLLSVFEGDQYRVRRVLIDEPDLRLKVNEQGKANWDIEKVTPPETEAPLPDETSHMVISLRELIIRDALLNYFDLASGTRVILAGLQHRLSGDFAANETKVNTNTVINSASLAEGGVNYLDHARIEFTASIDADLKNEIYTFNQNSLKINELILNFDGSLAMVNEDINITMAFQAPQKDFKHFLSLIPAIYSSDFEGIKTEGKLSIEGHIKGTYSEHTIPAFRLGVNIDEAMFQYPDLPYPVEDINIRAVISNTGQDFDNTAIDISVFHLKILQNPIDIRLSLRSLMTDPFIDGEISGTLDLANIKNVYPLDEGEQIEGVLDMNVAMKGNLSFIENEQYEDFKAMGSLLVRDFHYASMDFKDGMHIGNAQLNVSPAYLDLVDLQFSYRESDLQASGRIEQYLGYALADKTLIGNLKTSSDYFNVDDFMSDAETVESAGIDTVSTAAFKVPANIDFTMAASFKQLFYDSIPMQNVSGTILVQNQTITLKSLNAGLFDGFLSIDGSYSTLNRVNPAVDLQLGLRDISIPEAYATFGLMENLAPVAEHVFGRFSTEMSFNTDLDQEMMPILATMAGEGLVNTTKLAIEGVKSLDMLSSNLKIEQLKKMELNPVKLLFTVEEGKVIVKPFDIQTNRIKANVSGWTSFDQQIDYVMNLDIPRDIFGSGANEVLDNLVSKANASGANFSQGSTVNLKVFVTGTSTDPKVNTNLADIGKSIIDDTKKQLEEELRKKEEEARKKVSEEAARIIADADAQAQKILSEAQLKADEIVNAARKAADEVRSESDKQARQTMDKAKGKGTLAELGAKKAADEITKEGNKRADQIIQEADKQAKNIMDQARAQAKKVKDDAQKKADALN